MGLLKSVKIKATTYRAIVETQWFLMRKLNVSLSKVEIMNLSVKSLQKALKEEYSDEKKLTSPRKTGPL